MSGTLAAFSIGNLALNLVLASALKYLWNMMALLQFAIFMRDWNFNLPMKGDSWLESLRSLALFEFIETEKIREWFEDVLGIDDGTCPVDG